MRAVLKLHTLYTVRAKVSRHTTQQEQIGRRLDHIHPDAASESIAAAAAKRAGLSLSANLMRELMAVTPWALAMARRLKRDLAREVEVCSIFDPGREFN
jgi:hypothetical protein